MAATIIQFPQTHSNIFLNLTQLINLASDNQVVEEYGMEDETQFESVKTLEELSDLFRDFCKENGFKKNTVTYVEAV